MAKFSYLAKSATGQAAAGQIEANSEVEARAKLRAKNLNATKITVIQGSGTSVMKARKRAKPKDLQIFTRQFATLINAGIPISDALKILSEGNRPPVLKECAADIRTSIEGGKRLAEAMGQFPGVFNRLYVNMIRAGEEAGILDGILERLSIYIEKEGKIRGQVKGALVYPAAILMVSFLVITGMLVFIIPKFQDLYAQAGKKLPGLTQMVVNLSQLLIHKWHILAICGFGGGYGLYVYVQTPEGKKELDKFAIAFPVIGDVIQKASIARMSRTLSTLLSSGVGVIDALDIASRTSGNLVIEDALSRSKEAVTAGRPLAQPLSKEKSIPEMVTQMISIGEKSGTLDTMFGKVADFYEEEVEAAVKAMTALIEPIMMVFLGGVIAILVLAMYLPIFDMASLSGH